MNFLCIFIAVKFYQQNTEPVGVFASIKLQNQILLDFKFFNFSIITYI